jgi:hypothetical protein
VRVFIYPQFVQESLGKWGKQKMEQITLRFDAGTAEAFPTCRDFVAYRAHHQRSSMKAIAADMDYSPSDLSRKLAQSPNDSRRLTMDDVEKFMEVTGDTSPVLYLVEKYLAETDELSRLKARIAELEGVA